MSERFKEGKKSERNLKKKIQILKRKAKRPKKNSKLIIQ
jgi:hypothetical protein